MPARSSSARRSRRCSRGRSIPTRWACWARSPSSTTSASACRRSRAACPTWPHPPEGCRFAARCPVRRAGLPRGRAAAGRGRARPSLALPPRAAQRGAVMIAGSARTPSGAHGASHHREGARPRECRVAAMTALLEVEGLVKHFPVQGRRVRRRVRPCARGRRARLRGQGRRDPGAGRRIGLRQVDGRPAGAAPDRAQRRRGALRGRRPAGARRRADARAAAAPAGDLPGPLRQSSIRA